MSIRVVFFGTPEVAVPSLEALAASPDIEIVAAVTNPDRRRGRSKALVPPPVKVAAQALGLPVWQPAKAAEIESDLRAAEVDACAIVAYGSILPQSVLNAGGAGFVNLHFSLLPRWRGAAPVQHAIRAGDTVTGATTFILDAGMDTGPIVETFETAIADAETSGELLDRLATECAALLVSSVTKVANGDRGSAQPASGATVAGKITSADTGIDWSSDARAVVNLIHSANPAPGAHTLRDGVRVRVWRAALADIDVARQSGGTVVAIEQSGPVVATGSGAVVLTEVQPDGKARMPATAYVNGYRLQPGDRFTSSLGDTDE